MCKLVRKAERMAENTTSQRGMDIISCVLYIVHPGTLQWQVPESFPEGSQRFLKVPEGCLETLDRTPHRYNVRRVSWRRAPSVRLVTVPFDIRQWFDSIELFLFNYCNDSNSNTTASKRPPEWMFERICEKSGSAQNVRFLPSYMFQVACFSISSTYALHALILKVYVHYMYYIILSPKDRIV